MTKAFAAVAVLMVLGIAFAATVSASPATASSPPTANGVVSSTIEGALGNVPSPQLQAAAAAGVSRVIVNGGESIVPIAPSGAFTLTALPPGTHIVDIVCGEYAFPQLRIDVGKRGHNHFRVFTNDGNGLLLVDTLTRGGRGNADATLVVEAVGVEQLFVPREGFSIKSLVANPMMIMMLLSVGMVYIMPMLGGQEEMKKQMRELQRAQQPARVAGAAPATRAAAAVTAKRT